MIDEHETLLNHRKKAAKKEEQQQNQDSINRQTGSGGFNDLVSFEGESYLARFHKTEGSYWISFLCLCLLVCFFLKQATSQKTNDWKAGCVIAQRPSNVERLNPISRGVSV